MTVLVHEIGALAADNIATILARSDAQVWDKLVEGGWTGLGADPEAGLTLRDLQQIGRAAGQFTVPTPLVTTLLASRWFRPGPEALAAGVGLALPRGDQETVVPYLTAGMTILDPRGRPVDRAGNAPRHEEFSAAMPLGVIDRPAEAVPAGNAAELRAALAAVAVGCADAVADRSVAWVQTREQFGRPILAFQAVRHHLANLHIAREQAWTAAIACAHEPAASAAWARQACELSMTAVELGVQVHGGIGFTAEAGLHLYLDHILQIASLLGAVA